MQRLVLEYRLQLSVLLQPLRYRFIITYCVILTKFAEGSSLMVFKVVPVRRTRFSLDHTGHPVVSKLRECYLAAVKQGRQGQIPLWAGGGVGLTGNAAADAFKMICLGANGVFVGKILIQLLGCIGNEQGRCNSCSTGKCPTGICTQDPRLVKRLDVDKGAQNIVDYVLALDSELRKLMAPIGNSSLPVGRSDALVSTDKAIADKLGIQYVC